MCVWTWNASRLRTPGDSAWLASAEVRVAMGGLHPQPCCASCVVPGGTECKEQRDRRDEGGMYPATRREARLILTCGFHGSSGSSLPRGVKGACLSGP